MPIPKNLISLLKTPNWKISWKKQDNRPRPLVPHLTRQFPSARNPYSEIYSGAASSRMASEMPEQACCHAAHQYSVHPIRDRARHVVAAVGSTGRQTEKISGQIRRWIFSEKGKTRSTIYIHRTQRTQKLRLPRISPERHSNTEKSWKSALLGEDPSAKNTLSQSQSRRIRGWLKRLNGLWNVWERFWRVQSTEIMEQVTLPQTAKRSHQCLLR